MFANKTTKNEPKEAKIVKLNHSKPTIFMNSASMSSQINLLNSTLSRSDSFESESNHYSEIDEDEADVSGECLSKLWVIKDYKCELLYGDINVRKGQVIYLICESDFYYFIETEQGKQGFVPKEVCVNLEEMTRHVQIQSYSKITSL